MTGLPLAWGFTTGLFLPFVLACAIPEQKHQDPMSAIEAERIAYAVCGPDGTVDWDDNAKSPPPHCNRNGWNGQRYVEEPNR
jgi:hypothetical protein